jgi:peptidoglycan-associated lipoprotein
MKAQFKRMPNTMKLIKLTVLLALALAVTFSNTGCKKSAKNTTPLPGAKAHTPGGETGLSTTGGSGLQTETPVTSTGIATTSSWDPVNMNQDRARFAKSTVYFAYDSSALRSIEEPKLDEVATAMKTDSNLYLLIEGHCDERGTEEYNRSLGERRAQALREALAKAGVNPDHVRTISYGEDRPAVQGHDESAWKMNRRGEFVACTPK